MASIKSRASFSSEARGAPTAPTRRGAGGAIDWVLLDRMANPKWFTHFERFIQKPLIITSTAHNLNGTYNEAEVEAGLAANQAIAVTGTNQDDAGIEYLEGGGIRIETVGADADSGIILAKPTIDTNNLQSALAACNWDSRNQMLFYANILTGPEAADITNCRIWAGWKLTNTSVTATDADQAFFRFENGVNDGQWEAVTSVGGTDDEHDTNITVAAASLYRLLIIVDADRIPYYYINGTLVETGSALTALNTFEFYIGVMADGAAEAKELDVRNFMVSQLYG
jgi:hypothetical protein